MTCKMALVLVAVILTGCGSPGPGPSPSSPPVVIEVPTPTPAPSSAPTTSEPRKVEGRLIIPSAKFDEPIAEGHVTPDDAGVIQPRTRTEVVEGRWGQKATVYLVHSDGSGPAPGDALVTGKDGDPTPKTGDPVTLPDGSTGEVGRVEIAPKSGLPEWFWESVSDPERTYLVTCQPQEGRASSTNNVIVEIRKVTRP